MDPALLFFWLFASVSVAGAIGVIVMRQPIHSALFLLLTFLGVASLFLLARAELVAAVQILVYAGGIMILFLYTIFLVNVRRQKHERYLHTQAGAAVALGLLILAVVGGLVVGDVRRLSGLPGGAPADAAKLATTVMNGQAVTGNSEAVGWLLYRDYFIPFEVASVLLLVAMIGAVVLGKRTMERFD